VLYHAALGDILNPALEKGAERIQGVRVDNTKTKKLKTLEKFKR
jgi:uncharacterized protein YggE